MDASAPSRAYVNRLPGIYVRSDGGNDIRSTASSSSNSSNFRFQNISLSTKKSGSRPFDGVFNINVQTSSLPTSQFPQESLGSLISGGGDQAEQIRSKVSTVAHTGGLMQTNRCAVVTGGKESVENDTEVNELPKDASLLDNLPRRSLKRSCQVRNIAPGAYQENLDYEDDYPQDIHLADMTDSEEDPEYELPKKHISSSESDVSDAPTEPRKKKKNVLNNNTNMPPRNPHNLEFRDEHGNTIAPGTVEYTTRFAEHEQIIKGTLNKYKRDYKLFQDYVCHYFENGEDIVESMKPNDIDKPSLTFLISSYLTDRSNITHYRKTNEVRLLEPSTLERIWYGLSHMIKKEIGYDITKDEAFGTAKQAKLSAMRLSKKVPGLGENASASIPWTLSMVIYVLSNDMLNFYTPEGLIGLFYFLLMIYFLPRVKTEIMGLTRGDFVRVKNWKGETIGVVYVPKGTTKKDRGNKTVRDAAGYYKR